MLLRSALASRGHTVRHHFADTNQNVAAFCGLGESSERSEYPVRDSNPCYLRERQAS